MSKSPIYRTIQSVVQGCSISGGYNREKIIIEKLKAKYPERIFEAKKKVSIGPISGRKNGKFEIDILMIDIRTKYAAIIDSKSDGINNNKQVDLVVERDKAVENFIRHEYPGFLVETVILRPSGEAEKEVGAAGFKTIKTNDFIDDDIEALEADFLRQKHLENIEKFSKRYGLSKNEKETVYEIFKKTGAI